MCTLLWLAVGFWDIFTIVWQCCSTYLHKWNRHNAVSFCRLGPSLPPSKCKGFHIQFLVTFLKLFGMLCKNFAKIFLKYLDNIFQSLLTWTSVGFYNPVGIFIEIFKLLRNFGIGALWIGDWRSKTISWLIGSFLVSANTAAIENIILLTAKKYSGYF